MMKSAGKYFLLIALLAAFGLVSCTPSVRYTSMHGKTPQKARKGHSKAFDSRRSAIINEAMRWEGTPYCYGGENRSCTDCSGFVQSVYKSVGLELPRTAAKQYIYAEKINERGARPGDLVFFSKGGRISHVGLYIGGNQIIHASSSRGVIRQSLNDYYLSTRRAGFGRVVD
jgi:cell wall-associated NlpC family hydrolase